MTSRGDADLFGNISADEEEVSEREEDGEDRRVLQHVGLRALAAACDEGAEERPDDEAYQGKEHGQVTRSFPSAG